MKAKAVVAFVLMVLGTNLLTYATTRYLITHGVLTRAKQRLDDGLRREGVYNVVYPDDERIIRIAPTISTAIANAGGLYYWRNQALPYWAVGVVVTISGLLVTQLRHRTKNAG
ncbi:MAG: hypothetical protein U1G07_09760 [Verrucomicrobiota bacterium]